MFLWLRPRPRLRSGWKTKTVQKARSRCFDCSIRSIKSNVLRRCLPTTAAEAELYPKTPEVDLEETEPARRAPKSSRPCPYQSLAYVLLSTSSIVAINNSAAGQIHRLSIRRRSERGVLNCDIGLSGLAS